MYCSKEHYKCILNRLIVQIKNYHLSLFTTPSTERESQNITPLLKPFSRLGLLLVIGTNVANRDSGFVFHFKLLNNNMLYL